MKTVEEKEHLTKMQGIIHVIAETIKEYHPDLFTKIYTASIFPERLAKNIIDQFTPSIKEEKTGVEVEESQSGIFFDLLKQIGFNGDYVDTAFKLKESFNISRQPSTPLTD